MLSSFVARALMLPVPMSSVLHITGECVTGHSIVLVDSFVQGFDHHIARVVRDVRVVARSPRIVSDPGRHRACHCRPDEEGVGTGVAGEYIVECIAGAVMADAVCPEPVEGPVSVRFSTLSVRV